MSKRDILLARVVILSLLLLLCCYSVFLTDFPIIGYLLKGKIVEAGKTFSCGHTPIQILVKYPPPGGL